MWINRIFIFLWITPICLYADSSQILLEWKEIVGVNKYKFQLKDQDSELIKDKELETNKIDLKLSPGSYKYRVGSILSATNTTWNNWKTFLVLPQYKKEKEDEAPINIEWEPDPEINDYNFQVRDLENKIVFEKNLTGTKASFRLFPGKYEYRLKALKKDGKLGFTDWKSFLVKFGMPSITTPRRVKYSLDELEKDVVIEGKNFDPDMKVSISSKDEAIPVDYKVFNDKTLHLKFNVPNKKNSSYDVTLENPGLKPFKKENYITEKIPLDWIRLKVTARSAILPGWGQKYRGDKKWHAYAYPAILIPGALLYFNAINQNASAQKDYNSNLMNQILLGSSSNQLATILSLQTMQSRSVVNTSYAQANTIGLVLVGIYALNLVDAFLFHNYSKPIEISNYGFQFQFLAYQQRIGLNSSTSYELGFSYRF